jgi:hypothetical protein
MTLYLDQGGDSAAAFGDLYNGASRQDGGLGEDNDPTDNTVLIVTYTESAGQGATADRLNTLVNTDFGTPIVITALPGGIDPYLGNDVTGNGQTYVDSTSGFNVIRVVYDDSQCNGAGIFAFDTGGNQISFPGTVLLYHELSHAYRDATGTTQPNDEIPAETDENVLRAELGLCLRDVNNHGGGCGVGDTCGGISNNGCFIVSAAAGSSASAEVSRLKQLRDRVVRATTLGAQLLDSIYRDYYRFSPAIAADLRRDENARAAVLALAIRPLIAWYSLVEAIALAPDDIRAQDLALEELERSRPVEADARRVSAVVNALAAGGDMPSDLGALPTEFAPWGGQFASLPFSNWAIVEPLVRFWRSAAEEADILAEVVDWMGLAPLEALAPPKGEALEHELNFLARGPFREETLRRTVGARMSAAWIDAGPSLTRHGFIADRSTK